MRSCLERFGFAWILLLFSFFMAFGAMEPLLEFRMVYDGLTIDRTVDSVLGFLLLRSPAYLPFLVSWLIATMVFAVPVLYLCLATLLLTEQAGRGPDIVWFAQLLPLWSMPDVLALAAVLCLLIVQDAQTVTMVPWRLCAPSPPGIFWLVASGSIFVVVRTISLPGSGRDTSGTRAEDDHFQWTLPADVFHNSILTRGVLALTLTVVCSFLICGVSLTTPWLDDFGQGMEAVCKRTMPLLERAISHLPDSLGACDGGQTHLPAPGTCADLGVPLFEDHSLGLHVEAPWMTGLSSLRLDSCTLVDPSVDDTSGHRPYSLELRGSLGHVDLLLDVRQCFDFVGECVPLLSSSDSCCGNDIDFVLDFEILCANGLAPNVRLTHFEILDSVRIKDRLKLGFFDESVQTPDMAPQISRALEHRLSDFLEGHQISWGGRPVSLLGILSGLVEYNSPGGYLQC